MATAVSASTASSTFAATRDAFSSGTPISPTFPYNHKRNGSNQLPIPRMPKTQPPRAPPPALPSYDFHLDDVPATPSPFKRRDLIARTPDHTFAYPRGEWSSLNPSHDSGAYPQMDPFKRPDALTPENSSEEDREVEETPIYLRSERFRMSQINGRYTPNSQEEEYDADSILGAYKESKRYSYASDNIIHARMSSSPPEDMQTLDEPSYLQAHRSSWTARRDITPSKIPIFHASPKPIPMEYIFRSAPLHRSPSQPLDEIVDDSYNLKRVRSESLLDSNNPTPSSRNNSPTKRKYSTLPRPRSRSLSSMRPHLGTPRSVSSKFTPSPAKRPPSAKGEPPWIQHTFSPSPYLPPEEQLIPTVAKRIEQERLEREKGLVTVWDRDMRPLEGDRRIRESRVRTHKESDDMPTGQLLVEQKSFEKETWPLNIDVKKAKHNSLSVYPPQPISPGGPVRVDAHALSTTLGPMQRFDSVHDRAQREKDDVNKGCCCILM